MAMAPKLEIASKTHSTSELALIVADFSSSRLISSQQLFGGYSGSNYRVDLENGATYCLKITNGYTAEHADLMCRTAHVLGKGDKFSDCCLPIPKFEATASQKSTLRFVSLQEKDQVPAFLLTFIEGGIQADKVIREHKERLATTVMREIGQGLARMHKAVPINDAKYARDTLGVRWYESDGGCCDVQEHVQRNILAKLEAWEQTKTGRGHEYVKFYKQELPLLQSEMNLVQTRQIPLGITHGDPFADNVLVDSQSGRLLAFIDIEDVCAGPLLFDLACCAIGCCFDDDDNSLDMSLLQALLEGYSSARALTLVERDHFVAFMKLTLLCNCTWRFVKFNVLPSASDTDIPELAKSSYLELQARIEHLRDPKIKEAIFALLEKLPTE